MYYNVRELLKDTGCRFKRYEYSLLILLEVLHGSETGSSDSLSSEQRRAAYVEVTKRLVEWKDSHSFGKEYDEGV